MHKPDIEIYEYVLQKMDFLSDETILIDDSLINLESASKFGLNTYLVKKGNLPLIFDLFY